MAKKNEENLNFSEVISHLRKHLRDDGWEVRDIFNPEPLLPIDLYCTKRRDQLFIMVDSTTRVSKDYVLDKLPFYQYYLAHHLNIPNFKIILAVPNTTKVPTENFYKENGFGLWEVYKECKINKKILPITLRNRIVESYERNEKKRFEKKKGLKKDQKELNQKELKKESRRIAVFFDTYIREAVETLATVYPIEFEKRYISRKILESVFNLEHASYRKDLSNMVNVHLSNKTNESDFCYEAIKNLWSKKKYVGLDYSDLLKRFDPFLKKVFAEKGYRDHFIHQFQVFLLGSYIIDKIYDDISKKCSDIWCSWLITSTFHDFARPVESYDELTGNFFREVFNVKETLGAMDLRSNFIDKTFLSCLGYFLTSLRLSHFDLKLKSNWLAKEEPLVKFLHEKITAGKKHGVLGGMSLLKIARDPKYSITEEKFLKIFVPSALAIALHHELWKDLKKDENSNNEPHRILEELRYTKDPLSFLLIFCDNAQQYGRVKAGDEEPEFKLKGFDYNSKDGIQIKIWSPKYKITDDPFKRKRSELDEIQSFLRQPPNIRFRIHLEDKMGRSGGCFEMIGKGD